MKDTLSLHIKRTVLSPWLILAVILMAANDHVLKGAGLLPHTITGKLSDFAFLFFVPVVTAYLFRVKTFRGLIVSYVMAGGLFSAINLSAGFSRFIEEVFGAVFIPLSLWPDPTDLVALAILPCSLLYVLRGKPLAQGQSVRHLQYCVVFACLVTCVATSPAIRQPTHEPVYMPWKQFRSSVEVMPPQPIKKRGKIYIKDNYLYINEPNKGIHVIDNTNPQAPVPKCFLNIPGNTDLSIYGSYLYADSFVDLLVFALTIYPEDIILVNRISDVFPYNAYQNQPFADSDNTNSRFDFFPSRVNQRKGVVTGWRKIQMR